MRGFRFTLISVAFRTSLAVALAIGVGVMVMVPDLARAEAEKRVALVIGNGDYKSAPNIDNPPIDLVADYQAYLLKAEIGTPETENKLHFGFDDRKEVQQRLMVLRYYNGAIDGAFNDATRAAIREWQEQHHVATTGLLGPAQLAALRVESESMFHRYLAAEASQPTP